MEKTPFPVVAVLAVDWSFYSCERHQGDDYHLIIGWTTGQLIYEDSEKLVIAHQYFPQNKETRHTSVITRSTVKRIINLGNGGEPSCLHHTSKTRPKRSKWNLLTSLYGSITGALNRISSGAKSRW